MYDNILTAARDAIWLMTESKLRDVWTFLDRAASGVAVDGETLAVFAAANRERRNVRTATAVGVLPIIGTISQRAGMLDDASGGTSTEALSAGFDQLQAMDDVGSIVMDIDSGGGTYPGIPELANRIHAARGGKPIVAQINAEAGSGAYWLAAAADEVVITPSGSAGSIGAYKVHEETSKLDETIGISRRYIVDAGSEYKVEGNPDEPMDAESVAYHQADVDRVGDEFRAAVAKFRGVPLAKVKADFGRGRMLDAKAAVEAGMADRIATFSATIEKYSGNPPRPKSRSRVEAAKRWLSI